MRTARRLIGSLAATLAAGALVPAHAVVVPGDHYLCYKVAVARAPLQVVPKPPRASIPIADQFEARVYDATKYVSLCNPATKTHGGVYPPTHPDVHLVGYQIKLSKVLAQTEGVDKTVPHAVANQFGSHTLRAIKPTSLLVQSLKVDLGAIVKCTPGDDTPCLATGRLCDPPTSLCLPSPIPPLGTPPLPAGSGVDNFKCYKPKDDQLPPFVPLQVTLADQFGSAVYDLRKVTQLCTPADKDAEGTVAGFDGPHLTCYQARLAKTPPQAKFLKRKVRTRNANVGDAYLDVKGPSELCVPSCKDNPACSGPPPSTTTTTTTGTTATSATTTTTTSTTTPITTTTTTVPFCGDGTLNQPSEQCDGDDFGPGSPPTCSPSSPFGAILCHPDCTLDGDGCAPAPCIDLDIDSDNDNGTGPPDRNNAEENIEDNGTLPGKWIAVNDDDDDNDGVPDLLDGFNRDGTASNADDATAGENDFVQLLLEVPAPTDLAVAHLKFTYPGSDPAGAGVTASLRIWAKAGDQARNKASIPAGDYVAPGAHDAAALGLTNAMRTVTLYLEGTRPSAAVGGDRIVVEVDPDGPGAEDFGCNDAVRATVVKLDADVDSDNNNGTGDPPRSDAEDTIEDRSGDANLPGKMLAVNDDGDDNDVIDDYGDGYNLDGIGGNADDANAAEDDLIPLFLEVPAPINLATAHLRVTYADSDPAAATAVNPPAGPPSITPAAGRLRLWKKTGTRKAAPVDDATPGDWVKAKTYMDLAKLGLVGGTRTVTLYLEGIAPSASAAADQLKFELDPDGVGAAGFLHADSVRVTSVKIDFKLDAAQNFGYDEYRLPLVGGIAQPLPHSDFVSARRKEGDTNYPTTCKVEVAPVVANKIHFVPVDDTVLTVAPATATMAAQTLTITGKAFADVRKQTGIEVRLGDAAGPKGGFVDARVYKQNTVAKVSYYRIKDSTVAATTPAKNPTFADLKTAMNTIYKRGVVEIMEVDGDRDKDLRYDLNNNGFVDFYRDGDNPEVAVITGAGLTGDPQIAYVEKMRHNNRLAAVAAAAQDKVKLVTVNRLAVGGNYTIGPAVGAGEAITVSAINVAMNEITLTANLAGAHAATETVYGGLAGLGSVPQLVTDAGGELIVTIVHEMLHRPAFGGLKDLGQSDNVMYWTTGGTGAGLVRQRPQTVVGTGDGVPVVPAATENQWETISRP